MRGRILVADDQQDVLDALALLLRPAGYEIEKVATPASALESLRARPFDLLLMDLNYGRGTTSGQEGLDLLERIETLDRTLPVVVMTAWGSVQVAVEAMRGRLRDFVQKPWDNDSLLCTVDEMIERGRSLRARAREMDEAREIQRRLLPARLPHLEGYQVASAWRPARHVGGDYFDVLELSEDITAFCIADVVGKGLPAALLMSNVQAAVRVFAAVDTPPAAVCTEVNRVICGNIASNKFISFFYAVLNAREGRLEFANAGHNPPLHVSRQGNCRELADGGVALGIDAQQMYVAGRVTLLPGDAVLCFTDGLTEAENAGGDAFGPERLTRCLLAVSHLPVQERLEGVLDDVVRFSNAPLRDDATALLLTRE